MSIISQTLANNSSLQPSVLVTGASSGIGFATAVSLSKCGYLVYAGIRTDSDKNKLLSASNGEIQVVQLDVTSNNDISDVVNHIKNNQDTMLVALVNSAGICKTSLIEHCDRNELIEIFNVNTASILALSNAVLPLLQQTKGKVINIESTSSHIPNTPNGGYCISKAALEMMSRVMRIEFANKQVSVVSIQPGVVATPFWTKIANEERLNPLKNGEQTTTLSERFKNRQDLLKSFAKSGCSSPEEVATVVRRVIVSNHPKIKYIVGRDARLRLFLYKLIPERLSLYLTKKKLKD